MISWNDLKFIYDFPILCFWIDLKLQIPTVHMPQIFGGNESSFIKDIKFPINFDIYITFWIQSKFFDYGLILAMS